MPKAIHCPYFVQKCKKSIICEGGLRVEKKRDEELTNFAHNFCGNLEGYKRCRNARALDIKYGEVTEKRGRKKYDFTSEEIIRLKKIFVKHGWKPGYYTGFGCSHETCYRKLKELGLIKI
jgi:hypothetical protein